MTLKRLVSTFFGIDKTILIGDYRLVAVGKKCDYVTCVLLFPGLTMYVPLTKNKLLVSV